METIESQNVLPNGVLSAIKVFQLDDCDWWAGESLEACIAAARKTCGSDTYPEAEADGCELTVEQMNTLMFLDEDGERRTFAAELMRRAQAGDEFPCVFASTEY